MLKDKKFGGGVSEGDESAAIIIVASSFTKVPIASTRRMSENQANLGWRTP